MTERRVIKQQVVFKELALDFAEHSVIVHYQTEAVLADNAGDIVGRDVQAHKKRIRLRPFDESSDIPSLTDAIMQQCEMIPSSKVGILTELLHELAAADARARGHGRHTHTHGGKGRGEGKEDEEEEADSDEELHANLDSLDEYLERMYEDDMSERVRGCVCVCALAKVPENLEALASDARLMEVLVRVLKEDWKKSTDLLLVLMQFFFCFSVFPAYHRVLTHNGIGDTCMRILDLEHRRHTARMLDAERLEKLAALQAAGDVAGEASFRAADETARVQEEAAAEAAAAAAAAKSAAAVANVGREPAKKAAAATRKKRAASSARAEEEEEDGDEPEARTQSIASGAARKIKLKPLPAGRVDIDKEHRKLRALMRKQEGLMYVCVSLLINLAQDIEVERKMCNRNIVAYLVPLLDRTNQPLVHIGVDFLKKLSVFEENKDAMAALRIGPKLVQLLPPPGKPLPTAEAGSVDVAFYSSVLRLIFNLTFDDGMCSSFLSCGILDVMPVLLRAPPFRASCLKILYHLSQEHANRASFARTGADTIALVTKLVVNFPQPALPPELGGLFVNLCMHPASAAHIARTDGIVAALTAKSNKTGDVVLLKALRGLSQFTYALQADECYKAAVEDEVDWIEEHLKVEKEDGEGSTTEQDKSSTDAATADQGEEPVHDAAANTALQRVYIRVPAVPNEPIEYRYPFENLWAPSLPQLIAMAKRVAGSQPHLLVEVLGILANMTPRDVHGSGDAAGSWSEYLKDGDFVTLLRRCCTVGFVEDDILLEAVQLVSAIALDPDGVDALLRVNGSGSASLLRTIGRILAERAADTDLLMQVVALVLRLLHVDEWQDVVLTDPLIPTRTVELLSHTCSALVAEADEAVHLMIVRDRAEGVTSRAFKACSVLVQNIDTEKLERHDSANSAEAATRLARSQHLRTRRFELHNRDWVRAAAPATAQSKTHASSSLSYTATTYARGSDLDAKMDDAYPRSLPRSGLPEDDFTGFDAPTGPAGARRALAQGAVSAGGSTYWGDAGQPSDGRSRITVHHKPGSSAAPVPGAYAHGTQGHTHGYDDGFRDGRAGRATTRNASFGGVSGWEDDDDEE